MTRVSENADLLKLLLDLAFLFFGLLQQVYIAVEGKTMQCNAKSAIFPPFPVLVILFSGWAKIPVLIAFTE